MVKIFKTAESGVLQIENFEPGCWVAMTNPTAEELHEVATNVQELMSRIIIHLSLLIYLLLRREMRRTGMVQYHYRLCYAMTR